MNIPCRVDVGVLGWRGGVSKEGRERSWDKCVFELRMMRFKTCILGKLSFLLSSVNLCYLLFLLKHFMFLMPKLISFYLAHPFTNHSVWKCVLVVQSCPTLCNPMDYSLLGSSVHGIVQARILEWVAILFSRDLPNPEAKFRSPVLWADSQIPYHLSHQENHCSYNYFC